MDKYRIDSHKLIYHVSRVNDWLEGRLIYPIYLEVSLTGSCNHRCKYCALDFMEYKTHFIDTGLFKERISELGGVGVKSIMYAGEGEPFLHKDIAEIINHTKKSGIDVSITTNGVLFDKDKADSILGSTEWIKVSINGATADTYSKIHRCSPGDLKRVTENMSYAAKIRRDNNYKCTLGIQLLLLPENHHEAVALAKMAQDIGMDYLVIKPYSQHPQSKTTEYSTVKYTNYMYLADELTKLNTKNFNVIFRINAMKDWDKNERNYNCCLAIPFSSYIDTNGNVWGCLVYLNDPKFLYGNIYKTTFKNIWEGKKRLESLNWHKRSLDISKCRINCRMDKANRYLWELKNLPEHVNFI